MFYKLLYLSSFIFFGDLVNSDYVTLTGDTSIRFGIDEMSLRCNPAMPGGVTVSINSITLQKKNSNGQFEQVVKVFTFNSVTSTTWGSQYSSMQNRATIVKQSLSPTSTAGLEIEVWANKTQCSFKGEYRCEIKSVTSSGTSYDGDSNIRNLTMTVTPTSINTITRSPFQAQNVYNEYTVVTLSCSGEVGNPASNLRWCIQRNGLDSNFIGYPNSADITQNTATFSQTSCQYTRSSTLSYTVSAGYSHADFRCETGGTSTTCAHTSSIATNITITKYGYNSGAKAGWKAGVIAGGVFGAFVVFMFVIV